MPGQSARRDAQGHFMRPAADSALLGHPEPLEQEPPDETEAGKPEPPEESEAGPADPNEHGEPDQHESPDDEEAEAPDALEKREPAAASRAAIARVSALLTEALRLGKQHGLVRQRPDGSLILPGMEPTARRESSECGCPRCTKYNQLHWWCMACNSGPHDWLLVKPQYERQTLKPGGIEGSRHACCSAQCTRDYLAMIGRQHSGMPEDRRIDPTLALPMPG